MSIEIWPEIQFCFLKDCGANVLLLTDEEGKTMNVAPGVEALEIPAVIIGTKTLIYPTLIWDDKTTVLVDTGFPGQVSEFRRAIVGAGTSLEKIDKIIITHHDRDHIGSLRKILTELPQKASVLAHEKEKEYLEGHIAPFKVTLAEAPDSPYPPEMKGCIPVTKG